MNKLALIIGGEPRFVEKSFRENAMFWNWLNENYIVDVHVHSWDQKLEWNKKDHDELRFNSVRNSSETYYPDGMTTKLIKNIDPKIIKQEFMVYNPKTIEVEKYDENRFTNDTFPFGQYVSRSKAYAQALEYGDYDYVWLTRSDCVYDSNRPAMFTHLEDLKGKILCDETRVSDEGYFTTQDWFYAGQTELFSNLKLFADDYETYFDNNVESLPWYNKLLSEGQLRNSHIWQGLIANGLGENLFVETSQNWKLLHNA